MAEVEDTLKRIEAREDVVGIIIVNLDGVYLRSTLDDALTAQCTKHLDRLTVMARSVVRNIDPEDDLTFLRLRIEKNDKHEIMVGLGGCLMIPGTNISFTQSLTSCSSLSFVFAENDYLVIVIQKIR
nr:dynein light chain roadblock-type 2 isoform X1 [Nothobranchius furzeri]